MDTIMKCEDCGREFFGFEAESFIPHYDGDIEELDFENEPCCPYCESLNVRLKS